MNFSNKLFLSLGVLTSLGLSGMQNTDMQVIRDGTNFSVLDNGCEHSVNNNDVCKPLWRQSAEYLQRFELLGGRYKAIKLSNGDYIIREKGQLKGGGGLFAAVVALVGYPLVGVASVATAISVSVSTMDIGAGLTAGGIVATSGCAAVTYAVVATAATPTP